jgi:hypothetical protein
MDEVLNLLLNGPIVQEVHIEVCKYLATRRRQTEHLAHPDDRASKSLRLIIPKSPAPVRVLSNDLPDNRQGLPGRLLGRQGRISDVAHKLRDVMIYVFLGPTLAAGNGYVHRISVVHGSRSLTYDVENPSQGIGVCIFEEKFADPVPGSHPSAGNKNVPVAHLNVGIGEQSAHFVQIGCEMPIVHNGLGI